MSKPSSKAAKHSAAGHKKKCETPEHGGRGGGSPTNSLLSETGGDGAVMGGEIHPLDKVLTGEDIETLRITDDKLSKLHSPSPAPTSQPPPLRDSSRRVMVQRSKAQEDTHSRKKRVAVLRPLPAGASVSTTRTLELGRRENRESLSPYKVLGNTGDTQETAHGQSENTHLEDHTAPISQPEHVPISPPHTFTYQDTIIPRETHALQYWEEAMEERKQQQQYLSEKLEKSLEMLAMNQGDNYRKVQEERMLIDRAIPPLDYGKGYRVGSEFWSQSVPIGDTETGINTTLSRSEKGQPLPLELVGISKAVRREKGMPSAERNAPLHYTWQTTPYLISRTQQLHSTLTNTLQPNMDDLEVIGHAMHHYSEDHDPPNYSTDPLDSLGEEEEDYSEDSLSINDDENNPPHNQITSLDMLPDTFTHPLVGPALTIRNHLLKWEGAPSGETSSELVHFRVLFEAGIEEVTSCLDMQNSGTTAIYYSWKHLVQPNPLKTVQAGDAQRFYFDTRGGVLLPGQQLSFPFVFKSLNAGIFTETWALQTGPVLAGGKGIVITLRGVAFQEDTNVHKRDELERELNHRVAVVAAERLIDQIVDSITTPPHSTPTLLYTPTEEDVFRAQNPCLFYHYNIVQQLKTLYDEILRPDLLQDYLPPSATPRGDTGHTPTPSKRGEKGKPVGSGKEKARAVGKAVKEAEITEEPAEKVTSTVPDWDLSTDSLLQVVVGIEEDETRESKLKLLNELLGELSFTPPSLPHISSYTLVYQLVGEAMEQVSASSQHLCRVMGLPQRESCPVKASSSSAEDDQLSSTASSSTMTSKKEKEKKGKKQESKKSGAAKDKDKDRAPSRSKGVAGKKSKTSVTYRDNEITEIPLDTPQPAQQQIDPVLEKNYRENFHAIVYCILIETVDKMVTMLSEHY